MLEAQDLNIIMDAVAAIVGDDLKAVHPETGLMSLESKVSANKGGLTTFVCWTLDAEKMALIRGIDIPTFEKAITQFRTDARNKHRVGLTQGIPKGKYETLETLALAGVLSEPGIYASIDALGFSIETVKVHEQVEKLIELTK